MRNFNQATVGALIAGAGLLPLGAAIDANFNPEHFTVATLESSAVPNTLEAHLGSCVQLHLDGSISKVLGSCEPYELRGPQEVPKVELNVAPLVRDGMGVAAITLMLTGIGTIAFSRSGKKQDETDA